MKRTSLFCTLCFLLIGFSACSENALDQFSWLEGTWTHNGEAVEIWKRMPDGTYQGKGGSIEHGDTLFYEQLEIRADGSEVQYIPTAAHNDGPVTFTLTDSDGSTWTFENPEHDFPTMITYTFTPPNILVAAISGPDDEGGRKVIDFPYEKVEE